MPQLQVVGDHEEPWTIGYLIDVILTRDPWMHRIDISRATGALPVLTPEHDGVLVDDVVRKWAQRHGQPFVLNLAGPAGGSWTIGKGAEIAGPGLRGPPTTRSPEPPATPPPHRPNIRTWLPSEPRQVTA
jgi:hypothetical protein